MFVQLQCCSGVLDRVVRIGLDGGVEDRPCEEAKGEFALSKGKMINVDSVDNLVGRDVDVWRRREDQLGPSRRRGKKGSVLMIRKSLFRP
jgi:hypothetical protein